MALFLIPAFGITALLYAAIGFGGGSTYTALLAISGTDYRILPVISLICNVVVVAGGTWRFAHGGAVDWRRIWPFLMLSIPAAWAGGQLPVSEMLFTWLLASALFVAGCLILLGSGKDKQGAADEAPFARHSDTLLGQFTGHIGGLIIGAALGLLSGILGIGGGIFLAPLLYLMRWGDGRRIAGAASVFILLNSLAGLAGQFARWDGADNAVLISYWPLLPAVLLCGALGSWLGAVRLPLNGLRLATAALILFVSLRLFWRAAMIL